LAVAVGIHTDETQTQQCPYSVYTTSRQVYIDFYSSDVEPRVGHASIFADPIQSNLMFMMFTTYIQSNPLK